MIDTHITAANLQSLLFLGLGSFLLAMVLTPFYTSFAFHKKLWKRPRQNAVSGEKAAMYQKLHAEKHKRNIPTMAGVIGIVAVAYVTLLFNNDRAQTWLPLAALLGAGSIGLLDDYLNIRGTDLKNAGLKASRKMFLIMLVALLGGLYFYVKLDYDSLRIPFIDADLLLGPALIAVFMLVVVSTANAVNISDGLDGLAGGLLTSAFGSYAMIAFLQGNYGIAGFCVSIVGVLIAYTWFNVFPARFFMGDVGSFAFGTALGVVAMLTGTVLLLPIIGGVFVLEAGSSLVQILTKKFLHKKYLRAAPIHHHFEAIGWPETKVTMRFWLIGQLCGAFGVAFAILGGMV